MRSNYLVHYLLIVKEAVMEENNKIDIPVDVTKRFGYRAGQIMCLVFVACSISIMIGLTVKFLQWIF